MGGSDVFMMCNINMVFMIVSMITPLDSTVMNVLLCLICGLVFAFGLGAISKVVLSKTSLV